MSEERILILSTDATRTGTPILLLNYLSWIKRNSSLQFIIILEKGGVLLNDYKKLGEVYTWEEINAVNNNGIVINTLIKYVGNLVNKNNQLLQGRFLKAISKRYSIRLILSNTGRNGKYLRVIKQYIDKRILTYIHEGARTLELFNRQGDVTYNLQVTDEFVTVSHFVALMLRQQFNITQPINIVPGGVPISYLPAYEPGVLRKKSGLGEQAFVMMACGWLGWHKGTDLFVQLIQKLAKKQPDFHFIWLGGSEHDEAYRQIMFDIEKLDLKEKVQIITSSQNALDWLNMADLILMLSREESFSLVTIEAGLLKKPLLCFDQSGGPCEIVNFNTDFIVPYADIDCLEEKIIELAQSQGKREQMGDYLYDRVLNNYSIEINAEKLLDVINKNMNNDVHTPHSNLSAAVSSHRGK